MFILLSVSVSSAVETAERISDREIIESLATLKEGQKAMNQRLDQMFTFLWILTGIFTAMTATTISFAIWDRRSMLEPVNMKVKRLEGGRGGACPA